MVKKKCPRTCRFRVSVRCWPWLWMVSVYAGGCGEVSTYFYVDTYLGLVLIPVDDHVPWQEIVDLGDGMVGDAFEHVLEIDLRVEAVELG